MVDDRGHVSAGGARWRKARASWPVGECVELAALEGDVVGVRDSKDPGGPVLRFTRRELAAFLDGVRSGEFDDLAST